MRQWWFRCEHPGCGEEHGTTATERDYPGPARTAALEHADRAHPGENPELDVRPAG